MLSDNDKQRIEQAAKLSWKNTITAFEDSDEISFWEGYLTGAEYATLYERQQQQEATGQFLQALVERDRTIEEWKQSYFHELSKKYPEQIEKLEAERSELRNKVIGRIKKLEEFQKTINVPPGWIQKEIDFLNSLKK